MTPFISGRADLRARLGPEQRPWLALPSEQPLLSAALPCAWLTLVLTWPSGRDSCLSRRSAGSCLDSSRESGVRPRQARCPTDLQALLRSEPGCPRARVNASQAAGSGGRVGGAVAPSSPGICLQTLGSPTPLSQLCLPSFWRSWFLSASSRCSSAALVGSGCCNETVNQCLKQQRSIFSVLEGGCAGSRSLRDWFLVRPPFLACR